MAIDYDRAGHRLAYLATLAGGKTTLYLSSAAHFQSGFTDTDGNFYEPRMSRLVVDQDLGGFSLPRSSVASWTASFVLHTTDYDDTRFWTDFLSGNRLETMELTIWLIDPDADSDATREYLFRGFIDTQTVKIKPNAKVKMKAVGGPALWEQPILGQTFVDADFEIATTNLTLHAQDTSAIGVAKNWLFNCIGVVEGVCFTEGIAPPVIAPILSGATYRAVCFGYRLGDDETFIGNASWTWPTTIYLVGHDGTGLSNVVALTTTISDSTKSEYTEGTNPVRHLGYLEVQMSSSITMMTDADRETFRIWIDYPTTSTITDEDDIVDWMLFQSTHNAGYLKLGTGAQGSTWATYASEAYSIDVAVPGVALSVDKWPKLTSVLREIMWFSGHDLWLALDADGEWQVEVERRDFTSADATTLRAHDFLTDSLVYMIDPMRDYCNRLEVVGAERFSFPDATNISPAGSTHKESTVYTASEITAGLDVVKRRTQLDYVTRGSGYADIVADRATDLAQKQEWFEWETSMRWHSLTMHSVVEFEVGSFPTTAAQIRRKRVDYDRGKIKFSASTLTGSYTA